MSDLVGNPEARFSQVAAQIALLHEKTSIHITITETGTCTIKIFLTSVEIENFQLKLLFNHDSYHFRSKRSSWVYDVRTHHLCFEPKKNQLHTSLQPRFNYFKVYESRVYG